MRWLRPSRRPRGRPPHPDVLTPAEWRVLDLVREGRTNPEIGDRLGLSFNTVKTHVSSMLAKLGLEDRGALAAWEGEPRAVAGAARQPRRAPLAILPGWAGKALLGTAVAVLAGGVVMLLGTLGTGALPDGEQVASAEPTATATPAPSEATEPPPTPTPGRTPAVDLVDGLPVGAVGPLLVFGEQTMVDGGSRQWPLIQVQVYDVGTGQTAASFTIGGLGDYPAEVHVVGREVVVNLEHSIVAFGLDGMPQEVYRAPSDGRLETSYVSPDGSMIAFSERLEPVAGWRDSVVALDLASGAEVLRLSALDAPLSAVQMQLNLRGWQGDDRIVAIDHTGEGILAMVLVGLDGTADYAPATVASGQPSPDGSRMMRTAGRVRPEQFSAYGCQVGERLEVYRLPSDGAPVASATVPGAAMWVSHWSPDSDEVLFSVRTLPDSDAAVEVDPARGEIAGCGPREFWEQELQWYLLDVAGGAFQAVPDPNRVWRRWAGDRYPSVETQCFFPDGPEQHLVLPGRYLPLCEQGTPSTPRALIVDGREVSRGQYQRVFGWVDVP